MFPDANVFQYNYLDDDIDYIAAKVKMEKDKLASKEVFASYQKLPQKLVDDLNNPNIKWIILINPPFATAQVSGTNGDSKKGVSDTHVRRLMHACNLGEVSRELFSQFIFRIKYEFGNKHAYLALFSKIKYLSLILSVSESKVGATPPLAGRIIASYFSYNSFILSTTNLLSL